MTKYLSGKQMLVKPVPGALHITDRDTDCCAIKPMEAGDLFGLALRCMTAAMEMRVDFIPKRKE